MCEIGKNTKAGSAARGETQLGFSQGHAIGVKFIVGPDGRDFGNLKLGAISVQAMAARQFISVTKQVDSAFLDHISVLFQRIFGRIFIAAPFLVCNSGLTI